MIMKNVIFIDDDEYDFVYSDLSVCIMSKDGTTYDNVTLPKGEADVEDYTETNIIAEY